jgi:hypothetical protein
MHMDQRSGYAGLISPFCPLWHRRSPPVDGVPLQYVQCNGCAATGRAYWTEQVIALLRLLETRYEIRDRQALDFRFDGADFHNYCMLHVYFNRFFWNCSWL